MRGEVLKGHLELLVLSALKSEPAHGYAIIKTIRARSSGEFDLLEGSLYPALHRLEERGLVRSSWATTDGRRRRVYSITRKGRASLQDYETEWERFARAMTSTLRTA
jgi:PadR family transcriptional regulator